MFLLAEPSLSLGNRAAAGFGMGNPTFCRGTNAVDGVAPHVGIHPYQRRGPGRIPGLQDIVEIDRPMVNHSLANTLNGGLPFGLYLRFADDGACAEPDPSAERGSHRVQAGRL